MRRKRKATAEVAAAMAELDDSKLDRTLREAKARGRLYEFFATRWFQSDDAAWKKELRRRAKIAAAHRAAWEREFKSVTVTDLVPTSDQSELDRG